MLPAPLRSDQLSQTFARIEIELALLERGDAPSEAHVQRAGMLERSSACVQALIDAYIATLSGDRAIAHDSDLLAAFKVLTRADPSWNAIRDNLRELVYYRNCIQLGRHDALPIAYERMAVRIARHVFLYMRTRCEREGKLAG